MLPFKQRAVTVPDGPPNKTAPIGYPKNAPNSNVYPWAGGPNAKSGPERQSIYVQTRPSQKR
jgi:hypothetical protein